MNQGPNLFGMFIAVIMLLVVYGIVIRMIPKEIRRLIGKTIKWTVIIIWELFKWLWQQLTRLIGAAINLLKLLRPI